MSELKLLTDPFLQLPTPNSIRVVWFTEFLGSHHTVYYGQDLNQQAIATTTPLTRTREDQDSQIGTRTQDHLKVSQPIVRPIWRHEAQVSGLTPGQRLPYRVISIHENGTEIASTIFTLASMPQPGTPLKILLTSDHQLKPMTAANLQNVAATVGHLDAIFFAGDLVNTPDRASEWFDDDRGNAFFPNLQGRANYELEFQGIKTRYQGGELLQHTPLFTAIGNHDVMGRFSQELSLKTQLHDAIPRTVAAQFYGDSPVPELWLKDHSFNTNTYEEIFTLPQSPQGGKKYYAVTIGDLRLVVLFIANIWRESVFDPDKKGRYYEREQDLHSPEQWGYGQHIFEPIGQESDQYQWLVEEVNSIEFQQATYKVVMFHHPPHGLGNGVVPPYTDPVQQIDDGEEGKINAIRYIYPKEADYLIRDVIPLIESAGTQLVFFGHSHLWNRFVSPKGMHFLESSNVGNTYGVFVGNRKRSIPDDYPLDYARTGNPNGLEPIVPTVAPLYGKDGHPLPYIASDFLTVFSILETGSGTVSSYYFDTRSPDSDVVLFDQFQLLRMG